MHPTTRDPAGRRERPAGRLLVASALLLLAIGAPGCGAADRPAPGPVISPRMLPPVECDVETSHLPRTADAAGRWLSSCRGVPDPGYAGVPRE
jgi:hypothetical protein